MDLKNNMENNNFYAVIMAGGIGSRFWPISTTEFPKQFQDMLGTGKSLLQKTFSRLHNLIPSKNTYILTNDRYVNLVQEQLPEISLNQVILEPAMRNTAPCILLSSLKIYKENPDALMLVAPSDHWIEDEDSFINNVKDCFEACKKEDVLVTLGIHPTFPNTGYGYIEYDKGNTQKINKVSQFREKPDYETAKEFLSQGNFLWNAGIFIWSVKSILASFKTNLPDMYSLFSSGIDLLNTKEERNFILEYYEKAENISIDYGILERSYNVNVKKAEFDWNDLGTWGALYEKLEKDENNNATVRANTSLLEAKGNMIFTTTSKLVVIDGIEDYIIVDKDNVLMIYPKSKDQEIKKLVHEISQKHGDKFN